MKSFLSGNSVTHVIILLLGVCLFLPFVYKLFSYGVFRFEAVTAYGVIEDSLHGGDLGGRPFVEFKDREGQTFGFKTVAKTHWFYAPGKGEKVKVFYLEDDPGTAVVDSWFHYIILPMFLSGLGAALVFSAARNLWLERHPEDCRA